MPLKSWLKELQGDNAIIVNLENAVQYLLKTKDLKIKNLAHIAKKLEVSASLLSQYQSGTKPISDSFIQKFLKVFNLDLYNPFRYLMEDWVYNYEIHEGLSDIPASVFLRSYEHFRNRIKLQETIIMNLRNLNDQLTKANILMTDMLIKVEPICLDFMLNKKSGEKL